MYFGLKYILGEDVCVCIIYDLSLMSKRLFNARVGTASLRFFLMHFRKNAAAGIGYKFRIYSLHSILCIAYIC